MFYKYWILHSFVILFGLLWSLDRCYDFYRNEQKNRQERKEENQVKFVIDAAKNEAYEAIFGK